MAAEAEQEVRLYRCDYEEETLLGKPLFEKAPVAANVDRIGNIIDECRQQLIAQPDSVILRENDLKFVNNEWVFGYNYSCTESGGDSVSDLLFVARCYLLCCKDVKARSMADLNDINELFVRLQLLGCNHPRIRFETKFSHMEIEELQRRCACMVVYHLSDHPDEIMQRLGDGCLPPIDPLLKAIIEPLRRVPDVCAQPSGALSAEEQKRQEKLSASDANDAAQGITVAEVTDAEYDPNEGAYWHTDKQSIVGGFVKTASRVLRGYWLQKMVFDKYPITPSDKCPSYSQFARDCFLEWLRVRCQRDYSDSSIKVYRDMIYEHWMPIGARQETLRQFSSKHDFMQPLNLLEQQLGVDSATSLANLARVKTKLVEKDPSNEVYDFLVLSQFSYIMQSTCDTNFIKYYYILPSELGKFYKRLDCTDYCHRPRRPILLHIMKGWWVHDEASWIPCTDMIDALLKIVSLWVSKYESRLATGVPLTDWIDQLTKKTNKD